MNNDAKYPIRTKIQILPADEPKQMKLGFVVHEYLGSSCYLVSDPNKTIIDTIDGIKIGDEIFVWDTWIVTITEINGNKATAKNKGSLTVSMEFDIDDRHCWVATAMFNTQALERLSLPRK